MLLFINNNNNCWLSVYECGGACCIKKQLTAKVHNKRRTNDAKENFHGKSLDERREYEQAMRGKEAESGGDGKTKTSSSLYIIIVAVM